MLREGLLEDTLVEDTEGVAEVLEVGEADGLVPRLRDGQPVLRVGRRGGRRGRRRRRLLETQGLGRRLRVATDLERARETNRQTNRKKDRDREGQGEGGRDRVREGEREYVLLKG